MTRLIHQFFGFLNRTWLDSQRCWTTEQMSGFPPGEKCQNGRTKPPSHHVAPIPHLFEKTLYNVPAGGWAFPGTENSLQLKPPRCSYAVMGRPYWLEEASLSCYNTRHPKAQWTPPQQQAPYGKTPREWHFDQQIRLCYPISRMRVLPTGLLESLAQGLKSGTGD